MCQQFRFDNKSQFRVFLAKPQKAADLKTETGYDWDRLKLAYIPTLVATIDAAAAHYTEKGALQQDVRESLLAVTDLVRARRSGGIPLLLEKKNDRCVNSKFN